MERALTAAADLLWERLGKDSEHVDWILPIIVVDGVISELRLRVKDGVDAAVRARVEPQLDEVAREATQVARRLIAQSEEPTRQLRWPPVDD